MAGARSRRNTSASMSGAVSTTSWNRGQSPFRSIASSRSAEVSARLPMLWAIRCTDLAPDCRATARETPSGAARSRRRSSRRPCTTAGPPATANYRRSAPLRTSGRRRSGRSAARPSRTRRCSRGRKRRPPCGRSVDARPQIGVELGGRLGMDAQQHDVPLGILAKLQPQHARAFQRAHLMVLGNGDLAGAQLQLAAAAAVHPLDRPIGRLAAAIGTRGSIRPRTSVAARESQARAAHQRTVGTPSPEHQQPPSARRSSRSARASRPAAIAATGRRPGANGRWRNTPYDRVLLLVAGLRGGGVFPVGNVLAVEAWARRPFRRWRGTQRCRRRGLFRHQRRGSCAAARPAWAGGQTPGGLAFPLHPAVAISSTTTTANCILPAHIERPPAGQPSLGRAAAI